VASWKKWYFSLHSRTEGIIRPRRGKVTKLEGADLGCVLSFTSLPRNWPLIGEKRPFRNRMGRAINKNGLARHLLLYGGATHLSTSTCVTSA
jgi:hypothetical protein